MKNQLKVRRMMADGLTQAELAKAVGASRQTIIAIEQGRFNPSVKLALKIAQKLNASIDELFQLTEED